MAYTWKKANPRPRGGDIEIPDLRKGPEFTEMKSKVLKAFLKTRAVTIRYLHNKTKINHYELGLTLEVLEREGAITILRDNLLITFYALGGVELKAYEKRSQAEWVKRRSKGNMHAHLFVK